MEWIKGLIEFVTTYPIWAKLLALSCIIIIIATMIFAPTNIDPKSDSANRLLQAESRLEAQLSSRPGFHPRTYPILGFGMLAPAAWSIEDAAAKFGGGEVDLVKRYEETKGIVGMKFRVRTVQKNYINDPMAEQNNQLDVLRKIDGKVEISDVAIFGQNAKLFRYKQPTGERIGDIRIYWVRLIPEVKLELLAFIYKDSPDNVEFWREVENVIESVVLDIDGFPARRNLIKNTD